LAFIPDEAIERSGEVSPAAFRLYAYYCARRNKATGGWACGDKAAAEYLKVSRSRVCEARNELARAGWITLAEGDFVTPQLGFKPVEISTPPVEISTPVVEFPTGKVEISTASVEISTALNKVLPAHSTSPTNQATHIPRARKVPDLSPERQADISELHAHYCALVEAVPLDPNTSRTLNRALGEKGIAYCKKVVDGCALDDWPDRKLNNSVAHIFANGERMERLRKIADLKGGGNGKPDGRTQGSQGRDPAQAGGRGASRDERRYAELARQSPDAILGPARASALDGREPHEQAAGAPRRHHA
jgi:hypothetical protein